jgi:hypothetical protein
MKYLLTFLFWPAILMAQYPISQNTIHMLRFDGADGTVIPDPFVVSGAGFSTTAGGLFEPGTTSLSSNRYYVYTEPENDDVRAFGVKRVTNTSAAYLELPILNSTGRSLKRIHVTFRVWQITQNTRATRIKLNHYRYPSDAGTTSSSLYVTSDEFTASTGDESVLESIHQEWLTATIVFQTPIPADDSFMIGWSVINGTGSGSNAHLAIEEIRLHPDYQEKAISGDAGWRMLALPVTGTTLRTLSSHLQMQGVPGLSNASFTPNLYTEYDGTSWLAPSDPDADVPAGKGMIWYRFAGNAYSAGVFGHEPTEDVDVSLHAAGNRWNLVGNPYSSAISVASLTSDGTIVPVVQVWQDGSGESDAGESALGSWILSSDPLLGGKIAPWQAFMLQNGETSPATTLTIPISAKTSGGQFLKDVEPIRIPIELVEWRDGSVIRHDRGPLLEFSANQPILVSRLKPLDEGAAYGWFHDRDVSQSAMRMIDIDMDSDLEIPYELYLPGSGVWRIRWPDASMVPSKWTLRFHDDRAGVELDMKEEDGYGFEHDASADIIRDRFRIVAKRVHSASIRNANPLPERVSLTSWPNPFNPQTVISYRLSVSSDIRISVYDLLGREVAVLVDRSIPSGSHQVRFDATGLSSGLYVVRLSTSSTSTIHTITLLK